MLTRRGFSLVEILVGLTLVGLIGAATVRLLRAVSGAAGAQVAIAGAQSAVRNGVLALAQDLREAGLDTTGGQLVTDLEAIGPHRLTLRAMRGVGLTCAIPGATEFRVRRPLLGLREPNHTDGFLLFVESDPRTAADDRWIPLQVAAVDNTVRCGPDAAVSLILAAVPVVDSLGTPLALTQMRLGGPIRWFERIEYGPVLDPATGRPFVGVRSLSRGETRLNPVFGPLADTTGLSFWYADRLGNRLNPGVAAAGAVRSVGVRIEGVTVAPVSLAGTSTRRLDSTAFEARVALRNALQP